MRVSVLIAVLITLSSASVRAQSTVGAINTYVKGIERHTAKKKSSKFVFADTSNYEEGSKPSWRKFASEKALAKHREASETYSIAYTWTKGGKLVAANFTLFSPSGDWAKYVYHFFRSDGTLAKAEVEYRTFHGDFIFEQNLFYSSPGKLLKTTTAYKDLETGKPRKAPDGGDMNDNPALSESEIYKRVAKLPFARLIKK